ncbi:MAG: Ig-like domain-containing protein [Bacteroidales bacterium]|nr:Ig-like domain-containing protein [Bacteroidales bacterium]
MKIIQLIIFFICFNLMMNAQIVADHTVVDQYNQIPQKYIDAVKTMLVSIAGESHSLAYRLGLVLLEEMDNTYQVEIYNMGSPSSETSQYLRMGRHMIAGEDIFFSEAGVAGIKDDISDQAATGNPFDVMGFGWCWDMTLGDEPGGLEDPVYQVRWAGRSSGSPEGSMRWGLDAEDQALTGNSVSMDTYLEAVESYNQHSTDNSYPTKWIYTTGPVDWPEHAGTENGFQREIKHDYIRAHVAGDASRILFDYADILCWSNSGEQNMAVWNDDGSPRPHAQIHPENMLDYDANWNLISFTEDGDHIGEVGALRLAKAMWWMLARIAGWDNEIAVSDIGLYATGDTSVMTGQQLQLLATVLPENATSQEIQWSVLQGSGTATISQDGLIRGGQPGEVRVLARALDGSGVADTLLVPVLDPLVPVSDILITTAGGETELPEGQSLQCFASVSPQEASNTTVLWSIVNESGTASVSGEGLVTGLTAGTVQVIAKAEDGSQVADTFSLSVVLPVIPVVNIIISSNGGATSVESGSSLLFSAEVLPEEASNPGVEWSVIDGSGTATITSSGFLIGRDPGTVTVLAAALDGSGVTDNFALDILPPVILVEEITIFSAGEITSLETGSTLQFSAQVLPEDASNSDILWSVINQTGSASISASGLLTAGNPGTVGIVATAADASGVDEIFYISITLPEVLVESIEIVSAGGVNSLESLRTLQFYANILPENASNKYLEWSVIEISGTASVDAGGLLTAGNTGLVQVIASARDGSGISGDYMLTILPAVVEVLSIEVTSAGNVSVLDTGDMLQLYANVSPFNASNKDVFWHVSSSAGSPVGSITSEGLFIALGEGEAEVLAIARDGSGAYGTFDLSISGLSPTGIEAAEGLISIYPNPGEGHFYVNLGEPETRQLFVISASGAVLLERKLEPGLQVLELDLSPQQPGLYFIQISSGKDVVVKPIIIAR